jgi:hypothetical protein
VILFHHGVERHLAPDTRPGPDDPSALMLDEAMSDPQSGLIVDGATPGTVWAFSSPSDRELAVASIKATRLSAAGEAERPTVGGRADRHDYCGYSPSWTLFWDGDAGGGHLDSGQYGIYGDWVGPQWNDQASSIIVRGPCGQSTSVTAWEDGSRGGHSVTFVTDPKTGLTSHNLWDFCMVSFWYCFRTWNDQISSMKVNPPF